MTGSAGLREPLQPESPGQPGMIRQGICIRVACAALLLLVCCSGWTRTPNPVSGPWVFEQSGTTASLRGIHSAGGGVAWASGTGGTILRTLNGGRLWQPCAIPPGAEKLDFRGIWAWDSRTAVILSSGPGDQSRLYQTTDGCSHWKLLFVNPDKAGFWDAVGFASRKHGFLLGDPVDGRFVLYTTDDGGTTWKRSEAAGLAAGSGAEGAFAASNTALLVSERGSVLFGAGGAWLYRQPPGRTMDRSRRTGTPVSLAQPWSRRRIPLAHDGPAAGVFSIAAHHRAAPGTTPGSTAESGDSLVAVGGDYSRPGDSRGTAAWSHDGGRSWTAAARPPHGYRSAVAWDPSTRAWIAVGTNGSDISYDDGQTWAPLDPGNWNALSLPWVVGPHGRIARLDPDRLPKSSR